MRLKISTKYQKWMGLCLPDLKACTHSLEVEIKESDEFGIELS